MMMSVASLSQDTSEHGKCLRVSGDVMGYDYSMCSPVAVEGSNSKLHSVYRVGKHQSAGESDASLTMEYKAKSCTLYYCIFFDAAPCRCKMAGISQAVQCSTVQ